VISGARCPHVYYRSIRSRVLSRDVVSVCPVCRLHVSSRFRKHSRDDRALPLALSFPHLHTVALSRARGARPMRKPTDPHLSPSSLFRRLEPATSERACRSSTVPFFILYKWVGLERVTFLPTCYYSTPRPDGLTYAFHGGRSEVREKKRKSSKDHTPHAPGMAPGQHHGPRLPGRAFGALRTVKYGGGRVPPSARFATGVARRSG